MKRTKETFYLVDHEKIDKAFNAVLCDFGEVSKVVSDYNFSDKVRKKYSTTEFITVVKE